MEVAGSGCSRPIYRAMAGLVLIKRSDTPEKYSGVPHRFLLC